MTHDLLSDLLDVKCERVSAPIFADEAVIEESAIEFEHDVEDTEEVVDKFKDFLDEVSPDDFAQGSTKAMRLASTIPTFSSA